MRFLPLSLILLFAVTPQLVLAETAEKPYKATTVDECIQEKECVWFAFNDLYLKKGKSHVMRWEKSVNLKVHTENGNDYANEVNNYINEINALTPNKVQIYIPYNYLIIFTKNIDQLYADHGEKYEKIFGSFLREGYDDFKGRSKKCFSSYKYESLKTGISAAITFVETSGSKAEVLNCLSEEMQYVTALGKHDIEFTYAGDKQYLDKLDKMLILILYHPIFAEGYISTEKLPEAFLMAYEDVIKN